MVSADTGLKLTLPSSFTQNSFSMNSLVTASNPAAASASAMRRVRAVFAPPGSPRIRRLPMLWLMSPGSGVEAARWITQPTMRPVGFGLDPEGFDLTFAAHAQAMVLDGLELSAARDDRDVLAGTREPRRHQTTDGAGTVDANTHGAILGKTGTDHVFEESCKCSRS